jgi:hypothetical protein
MTSVAQGVSIAEAAHELYRVLKVTTACTCQYNVPYADSAVKREITAQCQRCKALAQWETLMSNPLIIEP